MSTGVTVLMYHGVGNPAPNGELHYTLSEEELARQLWLVQGRAGVATYEDFLQGRSPGGTVVLTFDDGERSVAERALPLMRQHGIAGTVFVTTGWIGSPGYLDPEQIGLLAQEGWTVGTHGVTHRFLSDLAPGEILRELVESRDALERILGHPPIHASLPGGRVDHRVLDAVRAAGYRSL